MKKTGAKRKSSGFTVIEMALALGLSIGIAGVIIGLLQQQVSFSQALLQFSFLRDDAPKINTILTNIVNKSDSYRVYSDLSSAVNDHGAVQSGGKAVRLRFRHPDGDSDHAIICFETRNGEKQLNYYFKRRYTYGWSAEPEWTISKKADEVTFDNSTGILLMTLAGSAGDEITYAGNPE